MVDTRAFSGVDISSNHFAVLSKRGKKGAGGSIVGSGIILQAGMSRIQFPMRSLGFFN